MLLAIAAMSRDRVIGRQGRLPWRITEEMAFFSGLTRGHVVLMGRRTFESLPGRRPLPERLNLVVTSRDPATLPPGVVAVPEPARFDARPYAHAGQHVFVIGGASLLALMLPRCQELFLSTVDLDLVPQAGDTLMPPFEHLFDPGTVVREYPGKFTARRHLCTFPETLTAPRTPPSPRL